MSKVNRDVCKAFWLGEIRKILLPEVKAGDEDPCDDFAGYSKKDGWYYGIRMSWYCNDGFNPINYVEVCHDTIYKGLRIHFSHAYQVEYGNVYETIEKIKYDKPILEDEFQKHCQERMKAIDEGDCRIEINIPS